jgi:hypothetical protein
MKIEGNKTQKTSVIRVRLSELASEGKCVSLRAANLDYHTEAGLLIKVDAGDSNESGYYVHGEKIPISAIERVDRSNPNFGEIVIKSSYFKAA